MTGEWQRPSGCDTSGCPEWHVPSGGGVWVRASGRPWVKIYLTEQERADLVRAAMAGELGPPSVD